MHVSAAPPSAGADPAAVASLAGDADREISLGAGAHGVAVTVNAEATLAHLGAQVADVTELQQPTGPQQP